MHRRPVVTSTLLNPPRRRRWRRFAWLLAQLALGVLLGSALFDRFLMPRVVGHGSDSVVPDIAGRNLAEARRQLAAAHLELGRVLEVPDATIPAGRIVRAEPPAKARVRRGRDVHVVVSRGTPERRVPDVTGLTIRHAGIELSQRGLRTGEIVELPSAEFGSGEILGTRPGPGDVPSASGKVDLLVSGGAPRLLYRMPELRGHTLDEAERVLSVVGVSITTVPGTGVIVRQQPEPGQPIWSGSSVYVE
jgi:serine/threonine-protein kinase